LAQNKFIYGKKFLFFFVFKKYYILKKLKDGVSDKEIEDEIKIIKLIYSYDKLIERFLEKYKIDLDK
jgi:hypothetical protein